MILFSILILFLLGLCIGSFLNVVADRLPQGHSLGGRSKCDHCHKTLSFPDLIPFYGFLFLLGKCRYCRKRISFQYPLIEFLTGILFVLLFAFFPLELSMTGMVVFLLRLILYSSLVAIFVSDIRFRIIPDELVVIFLVTAFGIRYFNGSLSWESIISGIALSLIFFILYVITRGRGMGLGDVKYVFPMGIFLGFPNVIVGFYVAFLTGAILSIILILRRKKRFGQTIAFGPFLVIATVIADIFGKQLWVYFLALLGV